MMILWEEYREITQEGYGYSRFCDLLRGFERRLSPVMRQRHVAGRRRERRPYNALCRDAQRPNELGTGERWMFLSICLVESGLVLRQGVKDEQVRGHGRPPVACWRPFFHRSSPSTRGVRNADLTEGLPSLRMPQRDGSFRRDVSENLPLEPVRKAAGQLTRAFKNQTRAACSKKPTSPRHQAASVPSLVRTTSRSGNPRLWSQSEISGDLRSRRSRSMTAYFKAHDHRVRRQRRRPLRAASCRAARVRDRSPRTRSGEATSAAPRPRGRGCNPPVPCRRP